MVLRRMFALKCPKVLITAVLLLSWMQPAPIPDRYHVIEFYAGKARVARSARAAGLNAAALDVLFHQYPQVFDMTSASGFSFLG
ncbi:unnamed protein product [Symbiodinium pilosum]|uniref:Uncharacterized protein n=1 Tax=Symbiodinium pilosum TaxID=2952 RepID=A0A812RRB7_SYMPI|nr:unnamed protein product [Symbiodinium pilosum]